MEKLMDCYKKYVYFESIGNVYNRYELFIA